MGVAQRSLFIGLFGFLDELQSRALCNSLPSARDRYNDRKSLDEVSLTTMRINEGQRSVMQSQFMEDAERERKKWPDHFNTHTGVVNIGSYQ